MDVVARLEEASRVDPETWTGTAEVTNAAAGTFPDGRRTITVRWQGSEYDAAYGAWYTPAAGDHVTFLKSGSSFFVLGEAAT